MRKEQCLTMLFQRIAPLTLAGIASHDALFACIAIHQLQDTRTAFTLTNAKGHFLHNQTQACICRRAFRFAQQARGCPLPCTRH